MVFRGFCLSIYRNSNVDFYILLSFFYDYQQTPYLQSTGRGGGRGVSYRLAPHDLQIYVEVIEKICTCRQINLNPAKGETVEGYI